MISRAAPARVGILGNPSDGYGGRTLALALPQFEARVTLTEAEGVRMVGLAADEPAWASVEAMTTHLDRHGYGTGPQLLAAATRTFVSVAESLGQRISRGFELRYETTIPRQVGLGGSSALVVAALRCLGEYHDLEIPEVVLPSIALRAETTQLGVSAGLQDRVVQTYGGLVAMDFGDEIIDTTYGVSHGVYEREDASLLPPLFLAYRTTAAEPSGTYHQRLRARYEAGDAEIRECLRELASLVVEGRAALRWRDGNRIGELIGRNMNLRRLLGPIPPAQEELVEIAEALDTTATFAGSGGAVVGVAEDDDHLHSLRRAYARIEAEVVRIQLDAAEPAASDGEGEGKGEVVALGRPPDNDR